MNKDNALEHDDYLTGSNNNLSSALHCEEEEGSLTKLQRRTFALAGIRLPLVHPRPEFLGPQSSTTLPPSHGGGGQDLRTEAESASCVSPSFPGYSRMRALLAAVVYSFLLPLPRLYGPDNFSATSDHHEGPTRGGLACPP